MAYLLGTGFMYFKFKVGKSEDKSVVQYIKQHVLLIITLLWLAENSNVSKDMENQMKKQGTWIIWLKWISLEVSV